ncbi:RNA-binding protein [bacterium]|nr:RNA-binding protein [bacterium]|tara:strand:- start:11762 stop:12046 length:285 start_codon:yes stop_codon:yes gene_type:complete
MNKKLYVGNLAYEATEDEIKSFFAQAGEVDSVSIITERDNPSRSKGFGFVEMATPEDAEKAIKELNGKELGGRALVVNEARPMKERAPRDDFNR